MSERPKKRILVVLVLCLALLTVIAGMGALRLMRGPAGEGPSVDEKPMQTAVLRSALAGTWYNPDPNGLRAEIAGYFQDVNVLPRENVLGLVLPHAGYAYSGLTAACGVKSLGRTYERVVVIGPTHQLPMEEILSVPRVTHYETPLGQVPLDTEFISRLLEYPLFQSVPAAHQQEHSVQIQVPLLQYRLGDFKLVPIVAGQCTYDTVARAGRILSSLIDPNTLVVASSDFTHYGPRYGYVPFANGTPRGNIRKLDMGAYEFIEKLDAEGFLKYRQSTGATICGAVPVAILLAMAGDGTKAELLRYTTSGELTGDYTNSVSYLAVVLQGAWRLSEEPARDVRTESLAEEDKKGLLALARQTIRFGLDHQKVPQPSDLDVTVGEATKVPRAAFVTLKKNGQLRGCIGDIFPQRPLYKSVLANAVYAAFGDRRFRPLKKAEYDDIKIEISALTVPSPVASPYDIRIGTDGMVLRRGGQSAVFLPQVAPEQGWDLETTLQHLSVKAGLPEDAWKEGARFEVFQAEVFGEDE